MWLQAAGVVARLLDADGARRGGASVKTLTLAPGITAKKVTHAVVCETLKHVPILKLVLDDAGVALSDDVVPNRRRRAGAEGREEQEDGSEESSGIDSETDARDARGNATRVPRSLAYVLGYEALFGAGLELETDPKPRQRDSACAKHDAAIVIAALGVVARARTLLRNALKKRLKLGAHSTVEQFLRAQPGGKALAAVPTHSRHARVNLLKTDLETCELELRKRGFENHERDAHVSDVLVFPPGTDLHDHAMVKDGRLILQGKSSCFPVEALSPEKGWTAFDCCAAPGNKTTHLAARVGHSGKVLAFDADRRRFERLKKNCARAGSMDARVPIVVPACGDFLALDPSDPKFASVRCVLLDPSCSGSGTAATRGDYLVAAARGEAAAVEAIADFDGAEPTPEDAARTNGEPSESELDARATGRDDPRVRVASLARFQAEALRKALAFPSAERVAYSTCSVYAAENERVVAAVLPEAKRLGYALERAIPTWPRRGLRGRGLSDAEADCLLRADQFEDDCEGFFVALFTRRAPPGARKAMAAAEAAEARAKEAIEAARRSKRRAIENGSDGVRPVYRSTTLKKRKKNNAKPLFR